MHIDDAFAKLVDLVADVSPRLQKIETEQDARFQLINRILVEVLGWHHGDVLTEPHSDSGYSDYLLSITETPSLVIEAKRMGKILVDTADAARGSYLISGPALKSASDGFAQAASYCLDHGVDLAALTTGDQWIAFVAFRGGGKPYKQTKAIVFPNFQSISDNFAEFYDLFSKYGVSKKLYRTRFARLQGIVATNFESLVAVNRDSEQALIPKTALANDLDPIFREFFGDLSGDNDRDMLIECFVETRESRTADAALQKMIGNISANVETISTATGEQLAQRIESAVETGRGENVLIVGNKGAGKTTFIERFFKEVLDRATRSKCVVVRVDFIGSPGIASDAGSETTQAVKAALEADLFAEGIPRYDDLQGLYFSEYQRWSRGQYQPLYEADKGEFKRKFGEFLDEAMRSDPFTYVIKLLEHAIKSRKLLPCFVFDNTDHHPEAFQEAVFQWSQAVRKKIPFSLVILPVTDRTIWRLSRSGPFSTYQSKMFYLPVPSTKEVLEKRVAYLKRKSSRSSRRSGNYFLAKGIHLSIANIEAFAACTEEVFVKEDFISRRIGWLSNHDVRRGLKLSQEVMTSPFLSIDELITAYLKRGSSNTLPIKHRKFMQALLLGDNNQFRQDRHDFVVNVFKTSPDFPSTPLLHLSVLKLLIDKAGEEAAEGAGGYLLLSQIYAYFGAMGISEDALRETLEEALEFRLVEPFDAANDQLFEEQRLAITHSGRMHYEMATTDPIYMSQMSFATPVRAAALVDKLRSIKTGKMGSPEWARVRRAFVLYCMAQDRVFARVPRDPMFAGQQQLRRDLLGAWVGSAADRLAGMSNNSAIRYSGGSAVARDRVKTIVKWFDPQKGFGFLSDEAGPDIFLAARLLRMSGFPEPAAGSIVICDVAPGKEGKPQAISVHSVEPPTPQGNLSAEMTPGRVKFYNAEKGFGFVSVEGLEEDVYIPRTVLQNTGRAKLETGEAVTVLVGPPVVGRGRAVQHLEIAS